MVTEYKNLYVLNPPKIDIYNAFPLRICKKLVCFKR